VQHAGQLYVVDVPALAADEPRVLLAEHAAEADRLLVVVLEPGGTVIDGGHDALPLPLATDSGCACRWAASYAAAHFTERTIVA
jgi:hypothetical protein